VPDTLDGMAFATRLSLYNNLLSGTMPPALGYMPRLQVIDAHNNHISGSLPTTIGLLDDLEHLLLHRNALRGPLPTQLGNLRAVRVVEISQNELTHEIPPELGRLNAVESLHLNDNLPGLSGAIPCTLAQLSNLQTLELTNNALNGQFPGFLQSFQSNRAVGITGNPYFCPLPEWSIIPLATTTGTANGTSEPPPPPPSSAYAGIQCRHCPVDYNADGTLKYVRADGSPDYTRTCSGHGICAHGQACQCDPMWDGSLSGYLDCSHLACPTEAVTMPNGAIQNVFCTGRGTCANTEYVIGATSGNGSVVPTVGSCVDGASTYIRPESFRGDDYVSYYVDCVADKVTIAHCSCPDGTSQPLCGDIILAAAKLTVLSAAPRAASSPTLLVSLLASGLAMTAAAMVQWAP